MEKMNQALEKMKMLVGMDVEDEEAAPQQESFMDDFNRNCTLSTKQRLYGFAICLSTGIACTLLERNTWQIIGTERESDGLYYLILAKSLGLTYFLPSTTCPVTDSPDLLHKRLGHPSLSKLQKMVHGLSHLSTLECESCQLGKHTRSHFPRRLDNRAELPFTLVHSDVWGPSRVSSTLEFRYFVSFIDDYSRCTWIFLMKNRFELFSIFPIFYAEIQDQFGVSICTFRSDNALEYLSSPLCRFKLPSSVITPLCICIIFVLCFHP
ncbi:retrovirus-related Pol polyprotein from transposon TNT 1-94 isoform X1 [Nicotiana tabacum]|uniref:Retrovirus-related Pol polyprotein from transposon TNT 1-94 isoform X1 n=1 Tax=Nicotiana tabacum TaxID=4097 RepID=A0AC58TLX5_TOBAC